MSRIIILDSGPLGMVTNPQAKPPYLECQLWLDSLLQNGEMVILPEIADYEVRRELIRAGKERGIRKLDLFKNVLTYRPLTSEVMLLAAQLWADARKRGKPTAHPYALDGDVILAAQAILEASEGNEVVIATTNVGHLSQFVDAREWRLIQ
ncbi:nucleic acid-binding protein [Tychonema sp. LEGE 07203]|uniref:nucleic acid-binding protein n=1 Tax=Tychonema sp. LEGE 07203 TaxID=1828671 RepID=UPI001881E458|nr:nucleic acid-binding protein [Tychonema sp. LEGE 07203]MBE9093880.1 nucleic acid-binding protein [Tychonema sp. LEGE 07203]